MGSGHQPLPTQHWDTQVSTSEHRSGARVMLAKWGAVLAPPSCQPQAGRGNSPRVATPRPDGTASPSIDTGLAGALCADERTKFVSKSPQLPKARGTPVWPVSGVSAGAVLARRDTAVTQGPGAPQPRQLSYQPPDGCCWAMAVSQPRAGQGGHPSSSGTATQPWASLYSLFFSPTQWKTIFERLHHAGVSGATGGERG